MLMLFALPERALPGHRSFVALRMTERLMLGVRSFIHTYPQAPSHITDFSEWITFLCGFLWERFCKAKMYARLKMSGMMEGRELGQVSHSHIRPTVSTKIQ